MVESITARLALILNKNNIYLTYRRQFPSFCFPYMNKTSFLLQKRLVQEDYKPISIDADGKTGLYLLQFRLVFM